MPTSSLACLRICFKAPHLAWLLICCTIYVLTSSLTWAEPDQQLTPDKFLRDYREIVANMAITYSDVFVEGLSGPQTPAEFTYVSSGECEKLRLRRVKPEYFDRVFVSRGDQKFTVRRQTAEGSYFVENIVDGNEDWPVIEEYRTWVRKAAYYLAGVPNYPEHVNSSKFAIRQVSPVSEAGAKLLNVEFEYVNQGEIRDPKLKGWFRLDPELGWVIRSYSYERRYPILRGKKAGQESISHIEGWTSYRRENARVVPSEIQMRVTAPDGKVRREVHFTISRFLCETAPKSDFSLGAFGFGDLEQTARQIETRNGYRTTVIALSAFLMSLLLLGVGRVIQKRRAHGNEIVSPSD